jgi:hypothetical protein
MFVEKSKYNFSNLLKHALNSKIFGLENYVTMKLRRRHKAAVSKSPQLHMDAARDGGRDFKLYRSRIYNLY